MQQLIVYGAGKLFNLFKDFIDINQVSYIVDDNPALQGTTLYGKEIISSVNLRDIEFAGIIIFANAGYEQIYNRLTKDLDVSPSKIIFWGRCYPLNKTFEIYSKILEDIKSLGMKNILDYGMNIKNSGFFCMNSEVNFMGYSLEDAEIMPLYRNLYCHIYNNYTDIPNYKADCAVLGSIGQYGSVDNLTDTINTVFEKTDTIYLECPYPDNSTYTWYELNSEEFGSVMWYNALYTRFLRLQRKKNPKVLVYIAAHKEYVSPGNGIYKTIWLGRSEDNKWNYLEDKSGDNISHLNSLINECTGLYWLWKNLKDEEYIGFVHYRRYFMNDSANMSVDNIIRQNTILHLMKDFDVIVHPVENFGTSVENQLRLTIQQEAYEAGRKLVEYSIMKYQPKYIDAFYSVMSGSFIFPCNMFITKKEIFDKYCEWLFSIIVEPAELIETTDCDDYSKRVIGFFAERLFTVWLMKQELKVKEMPVLLV